MDSVFVTSYLTAPNTPSHARKVVNSHGEAVDGFCVGGRAV
jgi:hypothetical protein